MSTYTSHVCTATEAKFPHCEVINELVIKCGLCHQHRRTSCRNSSNFNCNAILHGFFCFDLFVLFLCRGIGMWLM